jgi:hypothetical protein
MERVLSDPIRSVYTLNHETNNLLLYFIVDLWTIASHKRREYRKALKYIDVIVRTIHTEEKVPNP